jgi:tRNA A37 methylthiotransferase MiaB
MRAFKDGQYRYSLLATDKMINRYCQATERACSPLPSIHPKPTPKGRHIYLLFLSSACLASCSLCTLRYIKGNTNSGSNVSPISHKLHLEPT